MNHATLKMYVTGFVLSIALTLAAYFLVTSGEIFGNVLIGAILVLAVVQFVVQAFFFLHLGQGKDARWNFVVFGSTLGIILILVVGSIWIMNHLNYNMMASPSQMNAYIQSQDGL
jgi:cytochrome o ubiquinol oxidase operon protein cyoD